MGLLFEALFRSELQVFCLRLREKNGRDLTAESHTAKYRGQFNETTIKFLKDQQDSDLLARANIILSTIVFLLKSA